MRFLTNIMLLVLFALLTSCNKDDSSDTQNLVNHPFPNHTNYLGNHIKPTNYSQTDLDNQTSAFYENWKSTYLKNDCSENEYYIYSGNGVKTISEAQGYGMMITVFMSGYDSNAQKQFDGLYYYLNSSSKCNFTRIRN